MRVIIAGGRDETSYARVRRAIAAAGFDITEVVSGSAPGVDRFGEAWAKDHGIPIKRFDADWTRYGRAAGPRRNGLMAAYAEALIAIPAIERDSVGTLDMIRQARAAGLPVYIDET